jgi:hypothetical protein
MLSGSEVRLRLELFSGQLPLYDSANFTVTFFLPFNARHRSLIHSGHKANWPRIYPSVPSFLPRSLCRLV